MRPWRRRGRRSGTTGKAKQAAQKAFDLSGNLSREDRLFVEARYREVSKEWEKAVEIYRTLFEFFPDNLEYGLHLANAQVSAGKAKEALGTIERLRKLPRPASEDPRVDLAEASSAASLSDFRGAQAIAERAASLGARSGSELLVAVARLRQARSLWELGRAEEATAYYREAREICERLGDSRCRAEALRGAALIQWRSGQLTEARRAYETLIGLCRDMGYEDGLAKALQDLGLVAGDLGEHEKARELFKEALGHHVQLGDKRSIAVALHNTARTLALLGDLKQAAAKHQEALVLFRELGARDHEAMSLNNIAWILWLGRDLAAAQRTANEAIAISMQVGQKAFLALHLLVLGNIMSDRDDLAAARTRYDESLALRTEIGQKGAAAENQVGIALIALAEDRAPDAEILVRQALNEFRKARLQDEEAAALAVLIRTLVAQGKLADADGALNRASELLRRTQNVNTRLLLAIAAARLNAGLGRTTIASRGLVEVLQQAEKAGFYGRELEARLALGEIEIQSGETAAGRGASGSA